MKNINELTKEFMALIKEHPTDLSLKKKINKTNVLKKLRILNAYPHAADELNIAKFQKEVTKLKEFIRIEFGHDFGKNAWGRMITEHQRIIILRTLTSSVKVELLNSLTHLKLLIDNMDREEYEPLLGTNEDARVIMEMFIPPIINELKQLLEKINENITKTGLNKKYLRENIIKGNIIRLTSILTDLTSSAPLSFCSNLDNIYKDNDMIYQYQQNYKNLQLQIIREFSKYEMSLESTEFPEFYL